MEPGPAKKSGKQKRKESRRLVLPREDVKAVDKYSRRGYKELRQEENGDKRRMATRGERRQEGSCCAESCSRMPRELATVKKKDS